MCGNCQQQRQPLYQVNRQLPALSEWLLSHLLAGRWNYFPNIVSTHPTVVHTNVVHPTQVPTMQ